MNKNTETSPGTTDTRQVEMLSRRTVLRGALMAGCCLLVPIAIFSAPANGADAASKKLAKAGVKYQDQPRGAQRCSTCVNYVAASKTCKRVEGPINPEGWCILWAKA